MSPWLQNSTGVGLEGSVNTTHTGYTGTVEHVTVNGVGTAPVFHCGHGDLTGPLGLFVQGLLAAIAFACLIVKRYCEPKPERRPWKIWFFDTSKQGIGAAVIHFANVFLADLFTGDPCTWYVISFLLDSTLGLLVIYVGLKLIQLVVVKKGYYTLVFGEYGSPPQCNAWMGQCALYVLVILVEKILMSLLVLFHFWHEVRRFIMSPIKDPHLEIVIVMFIIPFIVNAIIFWIVDNFLKKKVLKVPQVAISNNETAMKYFKAMGSVQYYVSINNADETESDGLLSMEEDHENKYKSAKISEQDSCHEQYRLLEAAS